MKFRIVKFKKWDGDTKTTVEAFKIEVTRKNILWAGNFWCDCYIYPDGSFWNGEMGYCYPTQEAAEKSIETFRIRRIAEESKEEIVKEIEI